MNNATTNIQNLTMTSREITELTGKQHRHVKRDCEVMFTKLELDASKFGHIFKDSMNREQTEYQLTKNLTLTLISGYDIQMRHTIVERWQELEAEAKGQSLADVTTTDIVALAISRLQQENAEKSTETYTVTQLSKMLKIKPLQVNLLLCDEKLQAKHLVDGASSYELSDSGLEYGIEVTSQQAKVKQLPWRKSVIGLIKERAESLKPAKQTK